MSIQKSRRTDVSRPIGSWKFGEHWAYLSEVTPQATTANIDAHTTAESVAPYYHNSGATISGTLPDGVTSADRFRLEVLPLGDSYVEQRLTTPTNGSVAVYTRVYDGSAWGAWV